MKGYLGIESALGGRPFVEFGADGVTLWDLLVQLTPDLWPAFEDLFGKAGASIGCWYMYWHICAEYRKRPRDENKADMRALTWSGPPPDLLAFDGDLAVGWCQLTPRAALPWLEQDRRFKRVDGVPVWSITCFYIRRGYRRQDVMTELVAAAVEAAKAAGAPALEAYRYDASVTRGQDFAGFMPTFERAGFRVVEEHAPGRPIMRYSFERTGAGTRPAPTTESAVGATLVVALPLRDDREPRPRLWV